jgi:predicted small lipoprotein YifL
MTNRIRTGIALLMLSHGLIGCADQGSPTAPSAPPPSVQQPSPQPNPQPTGIQPSITAIAPQVGSTHGGAWATITGVDFQPGAKVRLGDSTVSSWTRDSTTISVSGTAAHAAGTVDVIVTNPGGLESRMTGAYTYEPPESFDFDGDWVAHAGHHYDIDMRFTIRNNVLVSASCGTSGPLAFAPQPSVRDGEFSFLGDAGVAISGTLVSPVNAVGTINVPGCPEARWWADKSGVAGVSRYVYTGH